MKRLSIIVPVYNMAADGKLEFCMESLVNQTLADYEIIAVNDASTDRSLEVLKIYEQNYPEKVRVIDSKVNMKQGGARNLGIKAARSEYVGFVDSDDWVNLTMFEKLIDCAETTSADIVCTDFVITSTHSFDVEQTQVMVSDEAVGVLDDYKYRQLILKPGSIVCKIYKKSLIVDHDLWFPENVFYEDNSTSILWLLYAQHLEKVAEPLYYYYQQPESTVHKKNDKRMFDRLETAEILVKECKKRGFFETYQPEIEYRFTELYYANTLNHYQTTFDKLEKDKLKNMRQGMRELFPQYRKNKYWQKTSKKNKIFTGLNDISTKLFIWFIYMKRVIR